MGKLRQLTLSLIFLGFNTISRYMTHAKDFKVYWNVPTYMCDNRGVYLNVTRFGIIQNKYDVFQGDKIRIWYHPGHFPHLQGNVPIDGGIPQNGSLEQHIRAFTRLVEKTPVDFDGVAVFDFEFYLPSYTRVSEKYKKASRDWVSSQHPEFSAEEIKAEAEISFNSSIKDYMEVALQIGNDLRPKALWGYYHYPYCKNHGGVVECGKAMTKMNEETLWIYEASKAMYPSIYLLKKEGTEGRKRMALGRILESHRINEMISKPIPIFTYCWYRYHEVVEFLPVEDIIETIGLSKDNNVDGSVIWGSSNDLNTKEKCLQFQDYIETVFGPTVKAILEMPESHLRLALRSPRLMREVISLLTDKIKE